MIGRCGALLALVAWQATLWRGLLAGGSADAVLWQAWLALVIYGGLGLVCGTVAQWIVQLGARDTLAQAPGEEA